MKEVDNYKFCPKCGQALQKKNKSLVHCESCKLDLFLNPKPCAVGVIIKDNKILLGRRARDPYKGMWSLPGGFVEYEETLEEALVRELSEELGVTAKIEKYLASTNAPYLWQEAEQRVFPVHFLCSIEGEPTPHDDVAELKWVSPEELDYLSLHSDADRLKRYLKKL